MNAATRITSSVCGSALQRSMNRARAGSGCWSTTWSRISLSGHGVSSVVAMVRTKPTSDTASVLACGR